MVDFVCPLCESGRSFIKTKWKSSKIVELYQKHYQFDATEYFPEDEFSTYLCAECGLQTHYPAKPGNSEFYDHMQQFSFYYENEKPEYNYALEVLLRENPKHVLEVGCGEGHFLNKIEKAFKVKGSEYSEKSIKKLIEKGIEFDSDQDSYDFILTFQVLEHVEDPKTFLRTIISKLEAGGCILITVPNNDSKLMQERFGLLDYPPHHMTQWTRKALENISSLYGLEIIEYYEEPIRFDHYMGLIKGRRNTIFTKSLKGKIKNRLSSLFDPILAPYLYDQIHYPGMTHGILLKKPFVQKEK